nr:AAA family ATPase [Saccharomonospora iraqiensis]
MPEIRGRAAGLNGPFGAGKTTVSELVVDRFPGSMLFDPEEVGFMLRSVVPPAPSGDFQDLPVWRSLTVDTATRIAEIYQRPLVVPMTLVRRQYRDEIFGGLRTAGLAVRHFFLTLNEALLRSRITDQVLLPDNAERDAEVRRWRLGQVTRCLAARADMPGDTVFLDSGEAGPSALADAVVERVSAD